MMIRTFGAAALLSIAAIAPPEPAAAQDALSGALLGGAAGALIGGAATGRDNAARSDCRGDDGETDTAPSLVVAVITLTTDRSRPQHTCDKERPETFDRDSQPSRVPNDPAARTNVDENAYPGLTAGVRSAAEPALRRMPSTTRVEAPPPAQEGHAGQVQHPRLIQRCPERGLLAVQASNACRARYKCRARGIRQGDYSDA